MGFFSVASRNIGDLFHSFSTSENIILDCLKTGAISPTLYPGYKRQLSAANVPNKNVFPNPLPATVIT